MKANRVPVTERLHSRIMKLEIKEDNAWVRIGGGNPYRQCRYCRVTNVEVTYNGHFSGCEIKGIYKEIQHYKNLLKQALTPSFPQTS